MCTRLDLDRILSSGSRAYWQIASGQQFETGLLSPEATLTSINTSFRSRVQSGFLTHQHSLSITLSRLRHLRSPSRTSVTTIHFREDRKKAEPQIPAMTARTCVRLVFLAVLAAAHVSAIRFYLKPGERRCFTDELPSNSRVRTSRHGRTTCGEKSKHLT